MLITLLIPVGAIVLLLGSTMVLAYLTDYEAAGMAGCIEEGQVW
jgi:predicted ribosomally synthesized peptide with SipW-like signal peptide